MAQQKKARKVGRPKLPKGEAKGRIVPVRFNADDLKIVTAMAKKNGQTISKWVRSTAMPKWMVACQSPDCKREFVFSEIDPEHPRQVVNDMPRNDPPKPPLRNGRETRTCPHCNSSAVYKRIDLKLNPN